MRSVTAELSDARSHSYEKNITETLEAIDRTRVQLGKIDNSLIDYASILAGYSKTIADIQLGNDPVPSQEGTQEVVPHNILDIREEEDVDSEAEEANDQAS